jgi:hypothetical protein
MIPCDLFLIYCTFCLHLFLLRYVFSDLQEVEFLFHHSSPYDQYTQEQEQFIYKQMKTDRGHQPEPLRFLLSSYIFLIVSSKWFLFFASYVNKCDISTSHDITLIITSCLMRLSFIYIHNPYVIHSFLHFFLVWHINHIYLPSQSLFRFIILWELGAAARNNSLS